MKKELFIEVKMPEIDLSIIENISYLQCEEILKSPFGTICKRHGKNCKVYHCPYHPIKRWR